MAVLSVLLCSDLHAADVSEKPFDGKATGKVYQASSADGLDFHYFIPRKYDATKGAALTVILHGSNLDRRWGFANHKAGDFRPNDIVISPDGTTANSSGGFNFLGRPDDATKFGAFLDEVKKAMKINAVYLYGHSQGSFFALYYAGEAPDAVNGVVAHASGVWTQTKISAKGHGQAIVLMHGTADPVVPYSQSIGGHGVYAEKGYPILRMRSLEGWNHWPAEHNGPIPHASQQLAWVEGMTATDTAALGAAYATLAKPKDKTQSDFAALYQVATRLSGLSSLPPRASEAAGQTAKKVDALATQHISAMKLTAPDAEHSMDGAPWIGHLPMFLRAYAGVPAADALATEWKSTLDAHNEAAKTHFTAYWKGVNGKDPQSAFSAGLGAMREAFLSFRTADPTFQKNMASWAKNRDLDLPKEEVKIYKALVKDLADSLKKGRAAFESTNKRF